MGVFRTGAEPALDAVARPGFAPEIDLAAEAAPPSHRVLRRAWFQGAGGRDPMTLVATQLDGRVLAALPTVATRVPGLRTVPGSYWPFRGVPIAEAMQADELIQFLASRDLGWAWRLGPVNADDPVIVRLDEAASGAGWTILRRRVATSFRLDLPAARAAGPWPRSSTLKKGRWHEKQLARDGALDWRFLSGPDWKPALFESLAAVERAGWVGETARSDPKFLDSKQRDMWERMARDPALAAMMHVGLLNVGGEPVAFSFGIEAGPVRYCIATSYDRRFAKHSPGKLISYRTYMDAADRGIELLDDGAGDGGHKQVMGESAGPDIVDLLFVRGRALGSLLRPFWERSGRLTRKRRACRSGRAFPFQRWWCA